VRGEEESVTKLTGRKRRLVLETPFMTRGRAVVVHVEASGLKLREKGQRTNLEISWAQVYNRAAEIAAVEGALKTEASQKDVLLDAQLAESLNLWNQRSPYTAPGDWVFASPHKKGRQPYWPGTLWRYYGKPAVKRAAVSKHVSYHTFRHTFGTLLNANGENAKVVQEFCATPA